MAISRGPKLVTNGLVLALDASDNNSFAAQDLPVKNGLALWLDAADDDSFVYSSGTSVSRWKDKSGNGRDFFQSTAGNQPSRNAAVNSRKAVQFTAASSTYLRYNNTIINNNLAGSVFVVWRTAGETQGYSSILDNYHCGANALGAGFQIERNASNNQYYWGFQQSSCTNAGRNVSYPVSYSDNTTYVYSITKDSSSVVAYSNGTSVTIESSPSATWIEDTKGWTIGCWGNGAETFGRFFNGIHCEVIIFNRGLSAKETKQVHTYLGQKWGIINTDKSVVDLSGNNYNGLLGNGTSANMPLLDYYNRGALKFDGSNDFIQYPSLLNIGIIFTINFWIKPTSNTRQTIVSNGYPYLANKGFFLCCPGNNATDMFLSLGNDQKTVQSNTGVITTGAIQMVTAVVNGTSNLMKLYVNGVEVSYAVQQNADISLQYDSGIFVTGKRDTTTADYLYSNLYALQIYNRALSAAEVAQNYNAQKSRYTNTIVQQGLVLNLDAANPYSYAGAGTIWYDTSGNSFNGTLTNGPVYSSTNSGIITFDGQNDYVDFTTSTLPISGNGARSIFVWMKTTATNNQGFVATGNPAGSQAFNLVKYSGNYVGIMGYNNDYYPSSGSSGISIVDGNWHYIGATFDGTNIRTYVDGILDNTSGTYTFTTTGQNNYIARSNHTGNENFLNGSVGLTQIYNRALSITEIVQNYNATKSRFGL